MANGKMARAYLDGFGTVRSVLDMDELTLTEILEAFDPQHELDPLLTPWKRGFNAAICSAFGH